MEKYLRWFLCVLVVVMVSACGGGSDSQDTSTYTGNFLSWTGSDDSDHQFKLVRVDGNTGAITDIGGAGFFTVIQYAPDGTLYGISDGLYIIDPSDGSTVKVGDFQYGGSSILMNGAAFSPDGTLYVAKLSEVFKVNLKTAALTNIGALTAVIWDLEFAPDATLYGAFADLFVLNMDDMSAIAKVGSIGTGISPMTFGMNGTLFGMDIFPSTHIYTISRDSGAATMLLKTGSTSLVSFVAERVSPAAAAAAAAAKRVYREPVNDAPSVEVLLAKEREIKATLRRD